MLSDWSQPQREQRVCPTPNFDTGFVNQYFTQQALEAQRKEEGEIAALIAARLFQLDQQQLKV